MQHVLCLYYYLEFPGHFKKLNRETYKLGHASIKAISTYHKRITYTGIKLQHNVCYFAFGDEIWYFLDRFYLLSLPSLCISYAK